MLTKTSESIVTFRHPFSIGTTITDQPAGSYRVTREEELIEGLSFPAYHVTSMALQLPSTGTTSMSKKFIPISVAEFDAALDSDSRETLKGSQQQSDPPSMIERARNFRPSPQDDS